MSNENILAETPQQPDLASASETADVPPGAGPAESSTGLFEKIKSAAGDSFERVTGFRRGRGRPRKDGTAKANDIPLDNPENGGADIANIDAEIIQKAVAAVVKAFCGVAGGFVRKKAIKVTKDRQYSEKLSRDCEPTEEEMEAIGKLADICLKKYGVGTQYMPEIGLGCIVLGIGTRYAVAFKTLAKEDDRQP